MPGQDYFPSVEAAERIAKDRQATGQRLASRRKGENASGTGALDSHSSGRSIPGGGRPGSVIADCAVTGARRLAALEGAE